MTQRHSRPTRPKRISVRRGAELQNEIKNNTDKFDSIMHSSGQMAQFAERAQVADIQHSRRDLTDDELAELFTRAEENEPKIVSSLGLPEGTDISSLTHLNSLTSQYQSTPTANERAVNMFDEEKYKLSRSDNANFNPRDEYGKINNTANFFRRFKNAIDNKDVGFFGPLGPAVGGILPDIGEQVFGTVDSVSKIYKERVTPREQEVIAKGLGETMDKFDVYAETVADVASIPRKIQQGRFDEIEPTFIRALRESEGDFEERMIAATEITVASFKERSLLEQILYGFADPFMKWKIAKGGYKAWRGMAAAADNGLNITKDIPGLTKVTNGKLKLHIDTRSEKIKFEQMEALKDESLNHWPSQMDLDELRNPRMTPGTKFEAAVVRIGDPSADIGRYAVGSVERVTLEALNRHAHLSDFADSWVDDIMVGIRASGDPNAMAKISKGPIPRAEGITHQRTVSTSFDEGTVFHGTNKDFSSFDIKNMADPDAKYGPGAYFTENLSIAKSYTTKAAKLGDNPVVKRAKLDLKNVFDADAPADIKILDQAIRQDFAFQTKRVGYTGTTDFDIFKKQLLDSTKLKTNEDVYDALKDILGGGQLREINEYLQRRGFDGITHTGGKGKVPHKVWIALDESSVTDLKNISNNTIGEETFKKLDEAPIYGKVFEHPDDYQMPDELRTWIKRTHGINENVLMLAKTEGLDIKQIGLADDSFYYYPRRNRDTRVLELIDGRTGNAVTTKAHRMNEHMVDTLKANQGWAGPFEAQEAYLKGVAKAILQKRLADDISVLAVKKHLNPTYLKNSVDAAQLQRKQLQAIRLMDAGVLGYRPSYATKEAWKRQFPDLAREIEEVTKLKSTDITELIRGLTPKYITGLGITVENFRAALNQTQTQTLRKAPRFNAAARKFYPDRNTGDALTDAQIKEVQEYIDRGFNTRLVERELEAAKGNVHSPGNEEYLLDDKGVPFKDISGEDADAFSRKRGYTEENIKEFKEFTALARKITQEGYLNDSELIEIELMLGVPEAVKAAAKGRLPGMKDKDSIIETIKTLGLNAKDEANLIAKTTIQAERLYEGARGTAWRSLQKKMVDENRVQASVKQTAKREYDKQKAAALGRTASETNIPDISEKLIFDKEDAVFIAKKLVDTDEGMWKGMATINGVIRSLRTTADFGSPFIHGLPLLMNDPEAWGKATTMHFMAFADPMVRTRYLALNHREVGNALEKGVIIGSTEFSESMRANGWLARLPIKMEEGRMPTPVAKTLGVAPKVISVASERFSNSFETFLDVARIETWKAMSPGLKTPRQQADLATFINQMTGATSTRALGISTSQRNFEAAVPFFAPRYFRASAGLVMDAMTKNTYRGELARKSLTSMLVGMVAVHVAVQQAMEQPIRLDPTKPSEFMRTTVAGQEIGFGGKFLTFLKIFSKMGKTTLENPNAFLNWDVFSAEAYKENPILSAIRNQQGPLSSILQTLMLGSNPIGDKNPDFSEPINIASFIGDQTLPFYASAGIQALTNKNVGSSKGGGFSIATGTEFGGGISHPTPSGLVLSRLYDKYSEEEYGMSWSDKKKNSEFNGAKEERLLRELHPDLDEQALVVQKDALNKADADKNAEVKRSATTIKLKYIDAVNQAARNYDSLIGENQVSDILTEAMKVASKSKRDEMNTLREKFPERYEAIENYYDELEEDSPTVSAMNEFFDRIHLNTDEGGAIDPITQLVNYRAMDQIKKDIDAKYGDGMMAKVNTELKTRQFEVMNFDGTAVPIEPRIQEKIASYDLLRPFFDAYKTVLPEEDWDAWVTYNSLSKADKASPLLRSTEYSFRRMEAIVVRAQIILRRENYEIDRALLRFHGRTPVNRELKRDLIKLIREAPR